MDQELVDYIINYYPSLLSFKEKAALKHSFATDKGESLQSQFLKDKILRDLATKDMEVLKLLDNGYDEFKKVSAAKILREHGDQVFINNCPKCGRLARTPLAKQCRHCGHNWH